MAIINVEGLGKVEIEGDVPNAQEQDALKQALDKLNETETTDTNNLETTEETTEDINISPNLGDTDESSADENITSEIIDSNLKKTNKVEGLDKFLLTRPVFESAGAIFGGVPGSALGPAGTVAFGAGGAMAGGQLYDILQSYATDKPTDFVTQLGRTKKDLQRELLLQSLFSKIPGLGYKIRGFVYGKADKSLYEAATRQGFPLSLSDAGNMIGTGYGRVIGIFPYVGDPIKKSIIKKSNFLNTNATKTLNTLAPNVSLTNLGIDMAEASKSTYGDFRRVTGFFYDDFFKAVDKVGNTPVIATKNFKKELSTFVNLVEGGAIKLTTGGKLKGPRKDALYKYAKDGIKVPEYINATQYKSLVEDIKYYSKLAQKSEPFNLKVLTKLKGALEIDLRLLTQKKYLDNLLTKVYPLSKSKQIKLDPDILSNVSKKLKFADQVYANGIENSILSNSLKKTLTKLPGETAKEFSERLALGVTPGAKVFEKPITSTFERVDKNIFSQGFYKPGSITPDQLGEALLKRNASPQMFDDLRTLIGKQQFNKFVRTKLQKSFDDAQIRSTVRPGEIIFDPYKFEKNLGLTTDKGREILETMLKRSKLNIQQLDDFFIIAKNHAGLKIPDVSSFLARRGVLGGFKSLAGGAVIGAGAGMNPLATSALFLFARKTSRMLANPGALKKATIAMDSNSPIFQRKTAVLKLFDAAISDSQNKLEENELKLMRETIESMSLDNIKKGMEETLDSSQTFLNMNMNKEEPASNNADDMSNIKDDTSQLQTPPLETVGVNPASFDKKLLEQGTVSETGLTQSEQAFLDDEEKAMTLRNRGMA